MDEKHVFKCPADGCPFVSSQEFALVQHMQARGHFDPERGTHTVSRAQRFLTELDRPYTEEIKSVNMKVQTIFEGVRNLGQEAIVREQHLNHFQAAARLQGLLIMILQVLTLIAILTLLVRLPSVRADEGVGTPVQPTLTGAFVQQCQMWKTALVTFFVLLPSRVSAFGTEPGMNWTYVITMLILLVIAFWVWIIRIVLQRWKQSVNDSLHSAEEKLKTSYDQMKVTLIQDLSAVKHAAAQSFATGAVNLVGKEEMKEALENSHKREVALQSKVDALTESLERLSMRLDAEPDAISTLKEEVKESKEVKISSSSSNVAAPLCSSSNGSVAALTLSSSSSVGSVCQAVGGSSSSTVTIVSVDSDPIVEKKLLEEKLEKVNKLIDEKKLSGNGFEKFESKGWFEQFQNILMYSGHVADITLMLIMIWQFVKEIARPKKVAEAAPIQRNFFDICAAMIGIFAIRDGWKSFVSAVQWFTSSVWAVSTVTKGLSQVANIFLPDKFKLPKSFEGCDMKKLTALPPDFQLSEDEKQPEQAVPKDLWNWMKDKLYSAKNRLMAKKYTKEEMNILTLTAVKEAAVNWMIEYLETTTDKKFSPEFLQNWDSVFPEHKKDSEYFMCDSPYNEHILSLSWETQKATLLNVVRTHQAVLETKRANIYNAPVTLSLWLQRNVGLTEEQVYLARRPALAILIIGVVILCWWCYSHVIVKKEKSKFVPKRKLPVEEARRKLSFAMQQLYDDGFLRVYGDGSGSVTFQNKRGEKRNLHLSSEDMDRLNHASDLQAELDSQFNQYVAPDNEDAESQDEQFDRLVIRGQKQNDRRRTQKDDQDFSEGDYEYDPNAEARGCVAEASRTISQVQKDLQNIQSPKVLQEMYEALKKEKQQKLQELATLRNQHAQEIERKNGEISEIDNKMKKVLAESDALVAANRKMRADLQAELGQITTEQRVLAEKKLAEAPELPAAVLAQKVQQYQAELNPSHVGISSSGQVVKTPVLEQTVKTHVSEATPVPKTGFCQPCTRAIQVRFNMLVKGKKHKLKPKCDLQSDLIHCDDERLFKYVQTHKHSLPCPFGVKCNKRAGYCMWLCPAVPSASAQPQIERLPVLKPLPRKNGQKVEKQEICDVKEEKEEKVLPSQSGSLSSSSTSSVTSVSSGILSEARIAAPKETFDSSQMVLRSARLISPDANIGFCNLTDMGRFYWGPMHFIVNQGSMTKVRENKLEVYFQGTYQLFPIKDLTIFSFGTGQKAWFQLQKPTSLPVEVAPHWVPFTHPELNPQRTVQVVARRGPSFPTFIPGKWCGVTSDGLGQYTCYTDNGDCGSGVWAVIGDRTSLIGFHIAGHATSGQTNGCVPLTNEMWLQMFNPSKNSAGTQM